MAPWMRAHSADDGGQQGAGAAFLHFLDVGVVQARVQPAGQAQGIGPAELAAVASRWARCSSMRAVEKRIERGKFLVEQQEFQEEARR